MRTVLAERMKEKQTSAVTPLIEKLQELATVPVNIMEVCGTHTVAIARSGLRQLIPRAIRLLSGPGCPVCVTSIGDIDRILALAKLDNIVIVTFGDMLHVPGSRDSLETARMEGTNVRLIYSPHDALQLAEENPNKEFVFIGVGFETTAPSVAATVLAAKMKGLKNFSVAPLFKLVPPALRAILEIKQRKIDGFILPGHVSTIIGIRPYRFIAREFHVPGVISGFEPMDILQSLCKLMEMLRQKKLLIQNQYQRSVTVAGNESALRLLEMVFRIADAEWRAIGKLPQSGLTFKPEFSEYDAFKKFSIPEFSSIEPKGCRCGEILLGLCGPLDCPLFRKRCTPSSPIGPCMVSSEGACAAAYHYGDDAL